MGVILGTAAYMSPEQARGRAVDKRTDIWAFGVVLYEMLTRKRAFEGEDVSLTLAAVMKSDPDLKALPPDVPSSVRLCLERCLQKDPRQRLRDIGDVRLLLDGAFDQAGTASSAPRVAPKSLVRRSVADRRRDHRRRTDRARRLEHQAHRWGAADSLRAHRCGWLVASRWQPATHRHVARWRFDRLHRERWLLFAFAQRAQ